MEAFSLLKYWRRGGGDFNRDSPSNQRVTDSSCSFSSSATTIVTAVTPSSSSDSDEGNDDGPFFDLEFTLPDDDDDDDSDSDDRTKNRVDDDVEVAPKVIAVQESEHVDNISENEMDSDNENEDTAAAEINFTISSSSTGDPGNAAFSLPPPSNDLFFPIDSSSMILNAASETIPKFPVSSILKSATKFCVQMLKFNKSNKSGSRQKDKPSKSEPHETKSVQKKGQQSKEGRREEPKPINKLLTVKLKVEEVMPLISLLFTRDQTGSTNSKGPTNSKANNRKTEAVENISGSNSPSNEDEKKFTKDMMNKYLKKVKPSYVRVSKRYGDKLRFPKSTASDDVDEQRTPAVEAASGVNIVLNNEKQGNLQAGLRVVCKHLGKSRSATASVPAPAPAAAAESSRRRDDSLLQQQDGIQSAILHCKRSFHASRGDVPYPCPDTEASILSTSVSDSSSSHENR